MTQKKVTPRPKIIKGCASCLGHDAEKGFWKDDVDPQIIRSYCKFRFINIDSGLMGTECDFFKLNPESMIPEKENRYGL
jgi:hypothetical protein